MKKLHLNDTQLFKEVSSVSGPTIAIESLISAFNNYNIYSSCPWNWNTNLIDAFNWSDTIQKKVYWRDIYLEIPWWVKL